MASAIRIYTSNTCPYCVRLKQLLDEANIQYDEVDVSDSEDRQQMAEKSGAMGIPQVEFVAGDKETITDYDTEEDVVAEVQEYLKSK